MAIPAAREPGPFVTFVLKRTVAKVLSIGFVVLKWTQCSAGYLVQITGIRPIHTVWINEQEYTDTTADALRFAIGDLTSSTTN
jgi:hypothetical protein